MEETRKSSIIRDLIIKIFLILLFVFLITDIISNNSQVIALGRQDIVERAFDVEIKENTAFLSGVVSRKKQVVPRIDSFIG